MQLLFIAFCCKGFFSSEYCGEFLQGSEGLATGFFVSFAAASICFYRHRVFYVFIFVKAPHFMPVFIQTALLLVVSNIFMTFAWYGHLRNLHHKAWYVAALISWSIALFEYLVQVPANRLGYGTMDLAQLKILQEAITLSVFVPFSLIYMQQPLKLDYLWAGLCLVGAVYFIFRT